VNRSTVIGVAMTQDSHEKRDRAAGIRYVRRRQGGLYLIIPARRAARPPDYQGNCDQQRFHGRSVPNRAALNRAAVILLENFDGWQIKTADKAKSVSPKSEVKFCRCRESSLSRRSGNVDPQSRRCQRHPRKIFRRSGTNADRD
jgi:hypothetical protein